MCGLFGYIGKKPANPLSVKLLWIYSKKRGTDSTGLYRNRRIIKSWYDYSQKMTGDSFEYLYGATMKPTLHHHTIIGHCRQKSVGQVTKDNTHPFEYEENGCRWIFAHNGTIKNIEDLAKKYDTPRGIGETDSQTFGHILAKGHFNVLLEYQGTAAFSLYNETEDTLYLWRGYSRQESTVASDERPLSVYEGKNYLYWASEELNLVTALNSSSEKNIKELTENTLYKFVECNLVDTTKYDRSDVAIEVVSNSIGFNTYYEDRYNYRKSTTKSVGSSYPKEPNPQIMAGPKIYFWNGKYYRSGHLLTGIMRIEDDGAITFDPNAGTEYYFKEGYMFKDKETYTKYLNHETFTEGLKKPYSFSIDLHPETFIIHANSVISNGAYRFGAKVKPPFAYHTYVINSSGYIVEFEKNENSSEEDATQNNTNENEYAEYWNASF